MLSYIATILSPSCLIPSNIVMLWHHTKYMPTLAFVWEHVWLGIERESKEFRNSLQPPVCVAKRTCVASSPSLNCISQAAVV